MFEVNYTRALALLTAVVAAFGRDHTAQSDEGGCIYFTVESDGTLVPVCIVGQVFARLGILRALVHNAPPGEEYVNKGTQVNAGDVSVVNYAACGLTSNLWANAAESFGVTFTEDAQRLLFATQRQQDAGWAWGEALDEGVDIVRGEVHALIENEVQNLRDRLVNESEVLAV